MKEFAIAVATIFILSTLHGCIEKGNVSLPATSSNPKYTFTSFYNKENISFNASSSYKLPVSLDEIVNKDVVKLLGLSDEQINFLEKHGFVIIKYGKYDDFSDMYEEIWKKGIPVFVTADTFLHLYHMNFNEILKEIEESELYDSLISISRAMFEKSKDDYMKYDGILKEASRRNVAYFGVALSLLGDNISIPEYVKEEVEREVANIHEHHGFQKSAIFHYYEDYSQYVPRGHYTQSEKLRKYFMAMMWYGRIAFFLESDRDTVNEENASIATIQAVMISLNLNSKTGEKTVWELWNRIYSITSFFVGFADDLIPYDYMKAINDLFGKNFNIEILKKKDELNKLRERLIEVNNPAIYGGSGIIKVSQITNSSEKLNKTKGMRFMGQRYVPDSYIFQNLVFPGVELYTGDNKPFTMEYTQGGPARCFPRGLDVMAVLGSDDALAILEKEGDADYVNYEKQMEKLKKQFDDMNATEWNKNLYFSWLYTIKSLLKNFDGYPSFMRTKEWRYKELQTSLASWTELRHDTILYAKQSYTPYSTGIIEGHGYLEPLPELYLRMLSLINMTLRGLESMHAINESQKARLLKMKNMAEKAIEISIDEIEGNGMEKHAAFFGNFVHTIKDMMHEFNKEARKTTMIADVHTDTNTMKCLEEGVGYVDMVIVAYEDNGKIYLAGGPVFSYYEFKQPIEDRLNDEKWTKMVDNASMAPWQEEIYPK